MSINCREDLLNRQAKVNEEIKSYTCRVLVCSGTGCIASGAQKIYEEMEILCRDIDGVTVEMQKDVPHIGVIKTGCQGLCELGPLMRIEPYNYQYVHVQPEDCKEIVERTILEGQPVERLFYRDHETVCPHPDDIPFLNQQTRIVLENCGKIDAESIDEYIAAGGYQALAKALGSMTPQDVIEEVTKSGLRGRGGAGFPAGKKWSQVARQKEKVRYVVCNGDEGDPGAFMDGSVMEGDPYKMIEGMTIAAYAVGAVIVANEAGTTRDAIDTPVDNAYGKFIFTDTAGLRKRSNITDGLERYMVVRALAAVERSRVALILVDATVGFTEQDSKVAGYAHDQGKACIIVVNKWDAVEGKETNTMEQQRRGYAEDFSFMGYAPIIFISAQTGYNVNKLMQLIRDVDAQNGARVPTGVLNEMLARATARMQPPSDKGRRLKIFYLTQASTRPPTFVAFVNAKHLFHFSYQRYLINQIRENFGLEHTPIRLVVRERGSGEVGAKDV